MSQVTKIYIYIRNFERTNHICGVMVSGLASSAVDCEFEPRLGKTKDYKIGMCCLSAKHAALRRTTKDCLDRNQNNVSEWGDMSFLRLLFQWASTIRNPTKRVGLVQNIHSLTHSKVQRVGGITFLEYTQNEKLR